MHPIRSSACAILLFLALSRPPLASAQINFAREPWEPPTKAFEKSKDRNLYVRSSLRTENAYPTPSRASVIKKVQTIRIAELHIPEPTKLSEVIKRFHALARRSDPDNVGVNLILSARMEYSRLVPPINPVTGVAPLSLSDYLVSITPPLRDLTLVAALEAIVAAAEPPKEYEDAPRLRYSIEDYAVVIGQRAIERDQLHTRTYKVDPNTFIQGLNLDFQPDPLQPATDPFRGIRVQEAVREFFQRAGVNLGTSQYVFLPGTAPPPQKAVFFNDRTGVLMIRATLNDLQLIEKALQTLSATPTKN